SRERSLGWPQKSLLPTGACPHERSVLSVAGNILHRLLCDPVNHPCTKAGCLRRPSTSIHSPDSAPSNRESYPSCVDQCRHLTEVFRWVGTTCKVPGGPP